MAEVSRERAFPRCATPRTKTTAARGMDERHGGQMNAAEATTTNTAPQHMRALARANKVRLARAELKRRIAQGEVTVAEVVLDMPWEAASMSIADLLMSQRRWGTTRCRKLLQTIPITETKTVGSMTDRQRRALAAQLAPHVTSPAAEETAGVGLPPAFATA